MAKFINVKKEGEEVAYMNVDHIMSITPAPTGCHVIVFPGTGKESLIELEITVDTLMSRIGQ